MKSGKSCSFDEINRDLFKQIYHEIVIPLIHIIKIIKLSSASDIFPSEFKLTKIIPLFKSGDAQTL